MKIKILLSFLVLTNFSYAGENRRIPASPGSSCAFKAQRAAQAIAQLNGLSGSSVEADYSQIEGNSVSVKVDGAAVFDVKVGKDCKILSVSLN